MAPTYSSWIPSYLSRIWQKPSSHNLEEYETHNIWPRRSYAADESEKFNSKYEVWQLPPWRPPKAECSNDDVWLPPQRLPKAECSNDDVWQLPPRRLPPQRLPKAECSNDNVWQLPPRRLPKAECTWLQTTGDTRVDMKAADFIRTRGREIGRQEKKIIHVYTDDMNDEEFAQSRPRHYSATLGQSKSRATKQQLDWAQTYLDRFLESEYSAKHIDSAGIVDFNGRVLGKIGDFPKVKKDEVSCIDQLIKTSRTQPQVQADLDVGGEKYQLTQVESDIINGKKDNKSFMIKKTKNHFIIGTFKESMNNEVCNRIENMGDSLLDQGN